MVLRAAWVIPVTQPPIANGFVRIERGRIAEVGLARQLAGANPETITDLGQAALLPGLVNPHTHLELTCYAGHLPPGPFWPWIAELVRLRAQPGQVERESAGVRQGAWQSLRAGVTCVGDISRRNLAWPVLKKIPIRKVCFVELLSLADHPPRTPDELRAGVEAVEEDDLLTVGVSPHAPYSVPRAQIRAAMVLAGALRRPWCTHWAETREELAFLTGGPVAFPPMLARLMQQCGVVSPRMGPLALLAECAAGAQAGALAHMNYLAEEEIGALGRAGHTVVYCPRAHRFFGHAAHPFVRLHQAGARLAIGTDSAASNDGLGLLEELHLLRQVVGDAIDPGELLKFVTVHAAEALGLGRMIGAIEPGRWADLAAFDVRDGTGDPVGELIGRPRPASGVWVGGERVAL